MIIARLAHSFPTRTNEWFLAAVMFLSGMILLDAYPTLATSPALYPLLRWGTEEAWGTLCLLVGSLRLVVLLINGSWHASPKWRAFFAFLSVLFWFQITLGLLASGRITLGLSIYPVFFLLDIYSMFRAGIDGRRVADMVSARPVAS